MNWLDKLERKFGKYYIPNLMKFITIGSALTFLITNFVNPSFGYFLRLIPSKVLEGEVWRLFTFVFITPTSLIFAVFVLYFYYMAGCTLEDEWGGFRFNLYYLIGYLATIIASFITGSSATGEVLNLSIFLAYAKLYPDSEMLLFFVIPIKIKWLGYFSWALIILDAVRALIGLNIGLFLITIVPVINYLLFFLRGNYKSAKLRRSSVIRMKDYKRKMNSVKKDYIHKCSVCGITDKDDPDMEFRYCSKCNGKHAYCEKHLFTHHHIQ